MADIIKYDMTDIWATSGDVVAPDSAKIRAGWAVEVVPRQWWNWFENRQDQNIAYMLQKGFPEWDATTEYIINKSYVQRNGIVYKATATTTGVDPSTLVSWIRVFADYSVASNALGAVVPVANNIPYFTSSTEAGQFPSTAYGRGVSNLSNIAAALTYFGAQAANTNLTAFSALTGSTNALPYFNGGSTMTTTALTAFARSLIDDVDAVAARATLEVDSSTTSASNLAAGLATKQPLNSTLTTLATLTPEANKLPYFTGGSAATTTDLTVFGRSLLDDADAAAARVTLEVDSASTVASNLASGLATKQPLNSNLTAWAGLTPVANTLSYWTSGTAATSTAFTAFARTILSQTDALGVRTTIGADSASNLTTGTIPLARIPTSLTGVNAETATRLATARTIQGVSFDGTANITLPVVPRDSATGAASMPVGDTSARPASPVVGMMRYNSDNQTFEGYQGGQWATVGGAGLPVGSLVPWNVSEASIPFGWLPRSGGLYNRADYPDLWVLIQSLVVSDADWISTPANRGKYSNGNGTTTFRMPDDNGKHADGNTFGAVALRGYGKNSAGTPGLHQTDQFQGSQLAGSTSDWVPSEIASNYAPATAASAVNIRGMYMTTKSNVNPGFAVLTIKTDGVNGTPRIGSETRMTNTTVIWCTVAAGKVNNIGNIDINVLNTTVNTHTTQIADIQSKQILTKQFTSSQQTITSAGLLTIPHGLGSDPKVIRGVLVCVITEAGFAVGTRLDMPLGTITAASSQGMVVTSDATNVYVRYGSNSSVFQMINNTNGNGTAVANVNWRLEVRAYA